MNASCERLAHSLGDNPELANMIVGARNLVEAGLKEAFSGDLVRVDDPSFCAYLLLKLKDRTEEHFHAIFLDRRKQYLADECIALGTVSEVSSSLRPLFRRAFDLGASAVILAHNHPSGTPFPSKQDRDATAEIRRLAEVLDIQLLDHLIVGGLQIYSIQQRRLLP